MSLVPAVPEAEVESFVSDFMTSSEKAQGQVLRQLRLDQTSGDDRFYCTRLGCVLVSPCRLTACDYHVDAKKKLNCVLSCRHQEANETCDLATALGVSEGEARAFVNTAVTHLREASLEEQLAIAGVNKFTVVPGTGVCVVCGGVAEAPYKQAGNYTYCSKACLREKPPSLLRLEIKYGADVRHVLKVALSTFRTIPLLSSALRIPRASLLRHYEFYLGVKPASFGADVADIVDLLRKKTQTVSPDFIVLDKDTLRAHPKWQALESATVDLVRSL